MYSLMIPVLLLMMTTEGQLSSLDCLDSDSCPSGENGIQSSLHSNLDYEREIILSKAVDEALEKSKEIRELEDIYRHNFASLNNKNSYQRHSAVAKAFSDTAEILEIATGKIEKSKDKNRSKREAQLGLRRPFSRKSQSFATRKVKLAVEDGNTLKQLMGKCHLKESKTCNQMSRYRSYSGACNSLHLPSLGASLSLQGRLLPAEYSDSISKPRSHSVSSSQPLPNPRTVSSRILERLEDLDPQYNLILMQWGQFIDHDFAMTPQYKGENNSKIDCSSCDSPRFHRGCFPILVPKDDQFYPRPSEGGRRCIKFLRSLPGQQRLGPRDQINAVSHWLDGSMVYGSDPCLATKLRLPSPHSHLLHMSLNHPRKELLPMTRDNGDCEAADGQCFLAGDERVNEHPGLTTVHTLLAREHNRIATTLREMNPMWDEEKVFQEARRIVAGIIQHITYTEFLPRVLGPQLMAQYSLSTLQSGYSSDYTPHCSAVMLNEFSTAAFRFGHSLIRANLTLMNEDGMMRQGRSQGEDGEVNEDVPLRKVFHDPSMIRTGRMIDSLVRGLVMSSMESMDRKLTGEVADHLFEEKGKAFTGLDLGALNIQRGRDHGLPGYNKYRELCGLTRAQTFSDLPEINPVWAGKLGHIYSHPDDVDLFVGMLLERRVEGAIVGPTLGCLLATQFRIIKQCDRFWYETGEPQLRFSPGQLGEIRGSSLSGLLCRNCDNPGSLPKSSMDTMQPQTNPMESCSDMNHINLDMWSDEESA